MRINKLSQRLTRFTEMQQSVAETNFHSINRSVVNLIFVAVTLLVMGWASASEPVIDVWPVGPHRQIDCLNALTTAQNNVQTWLSNSISDLQAQALASAFRIEDISDERKRVARKSADSERKNIELKYLLWLTDIQLMELACNRIPGMSGVGCSVLVEAAKRAAEMSRDNALEAVEAKYLEDVKSINNIKNRHLQRNSENFQAAVKRLRSRSQYFNALIDTAYKNCRNSAY